MHNLLIAILVVTFFLGVAFRFFLVLYAEGFVKKGTLDVKLLKQIYWLVWVVLVIIGLIPFAIAPIVVGDFPRDKYRSQLCLGVPTSEDENENGTSHLFLQPQFAMALMAFYMVRFVHRVKKYVHGQCPRRKMSSIGKYQRNVIDLNTTYIVALILHCFTFVIKYFRQPTQNLDKSDAFLINFVIFDSFIYLLSCCVFLQARSQEIPDKKDASNHVEFYVTKVKILQPRRPDHFWSQCSNQTNIPKTNLLTPKGPDSLKCPKEKRNQLGYDTSKTAFTQLDDLTAFNLKPKSCERFWIRRKIVANKVHPIVTIYNSKAGLKIRDESFKTDQAMRKKNSKKASTDLEMPTVVSDDHTSVDFSFEENPKAIIENHSEVLLVQVQSREEKSEKTKFKRASAKAVEPLHRFSYFTKI